MQTTSVAKKQAVQQQRQQMMQMGRRMVRTITRSSSSSSSRKTMSQMAGQQQQHQIQLLDIPAAGGAAAPRVQISAGEKLAEVKAADPLEYKEREQPAPLSRDFLAALILKAPPYADD
jgi:hypothetical protein